jgi:hypothetical protein
VNLFASVEGFQNVDVPISHGASSFGLQGQAGNRSIVSYYTI